ncbi:hypothetical protein HYH02_013441 [Chlamydomonas schloesseri]|uniref:SCP domain-containing protein n=1 Tax=Chlamydomonas schloesseri TaxID=2026947 RepID=A0A835T2K5_9CHLO|nr:hypothetical protein HYH02_013441 [Chlamydomonas schloesseri]|eukprot:KAG2431310.1 hypothetical protein HYH02_013441 [Chlamydomonas schloesseri]
MSPAMPKTTRPAHLRPILGLFVLMLASVLPLAAPTQQTEGAHLLRGLGGRAGGRQTGARRLLDLLGAVAPPREPDQAAASPSPVATTRAGSWDDAWDPVIANQVSPRPKTGSGKTAPPPALPPASEAQQQDTLPPSAPVQEQASPPPPRPTQAILRLARMPRPPPGPPAPPAPPAPPSPPAPPPAPPSPPSPPAPPPAPPSPPTPRKPPMPVRRPFSGNVERGEVNPSSSGGPAPSTSSGTDGSDSSSPPPPRASPPPPRPPPPRPPPPRSPPPPPPGSPDGPSASNNPLIDPALILEAHNWLRRATGVAPLVWDADLAASAQAWSNQCVFEHSRSGYGENLALGGFRTAADMARGVALWTGEVCEYDWTKPGFSMDTGHFTQVVWRNTQRVGCGFRPCEAGIAGYGSRSAGAGVLVCHYDPPGNYLSSSQFTNNVLRPNPMPSCDKRGSIGRR